MAAELIVALDLDTRSEAEQLVERLGNGADFFKIGYQLVYGGDGLALGKSLIAAGKRVFFDLKLLDIDNTVERGAAAIAETGAAMLTVHAYPHAMRAAGHAAAGSGLCVLGVSVLTSLDDDDLWEAGYRFGAAELVEIRAQQAREAGIGGLVCSVGEAASVRRIGGPDLAVVTPGIRPAGADAGDQKRVATPASAIAAGATHLVVGRPITAAADPQAALQAIRRQMAGVTSVGGDPA